MELDFLNDYIILVVVGICGCVGYVLKRLDFIPNKFIPLILMTLGMGINILTNLPVFNASVVLGGMASGLASTGTYEAIRHLVNCKKEDEEDDNKNDSENDSVK